jgi:hypothetical protein
MWLSRLLLGVWFFAVLGAAQCHLYTGSANVVKVANHACCLHELTIRYEYVTTKFIQQDSHEGKQLGLSWRTGLVQVVEKAKSVTRDAFVDDLNEAVRTVLSETLNESVTF